MLRRLGRLLSPIFYKNFIDSQMLDVVLGAGSLTMSKLVPNAFLMVVSLTQGNVEEAILV